MKIAITPNQLQKVVEAMGGDKDFPKLTTDPYVNYLVDCLVDDEFAQHAKYNEAEYMKEIEADKTRL